MSETIFEDVFDWMITRINEVLKIVSAHVGNKNTNMRDVTPFANYTTNTVIGNSFYDLKFISCISAQVYTARF